MSTTMPNAQNITRKWYVIDAADKPLGRTAALAADLLRGKHKPIFAPHVDCGDHVIIINAEKLFSPVRNWFRKFTIITLVGSAA